MQTEEGRLRVYTESDAKLHEQSSKPTIARGAASLYQPSKSKCEQNERSETGPNRSYNNIMCGIPPPIHDKTAKIKSPIRLQESTGRFSVPSEDYDDTINLFSTMPPKKVVSNEKDNLYEEIIDDVRYENLSTLRTEAPPLPYRSRSAVILEKPPSQQALAISSRPRSALLHSCESHEQERLSPAGMYVNERRRARSVSPNDRSRQTQSKYKLYFHTLRLSTHMHSCKLTLIPLDTACIYLITLGRHYFHRYSVFTVLHILLVI